MTTIARTQLRPAERTRVSVVATVRDPIHASQSGRVTMPAPELGQELYRDHVPGQPDLSAASPAGVDYRDVHVRQPERQFPAVFLDCTWRENKRRKFGSKNSALRLLSLDSSKRTEERQVSCTRIPPGSVQQAVKAHAQVQRQEGGLLPLDARGRLLSGAPECSDGGRRGFDKAAVPHLRMHRRTQRHSEHPSMSLMKQVNARLPVHSLLAVCLASDAGKERVEAAA